MAFSTTHIIQIQTNYLISQGVARCSSLQIGRFRLSVPMSSNENFVTSNHDDAAIEFYDQSRTNYLF